MESLLSAAQMAAPGQLKLRHCLGGENWQLVSCPCVAFDSYEEPWEE